MAHICDRCKQDKELTELILLKKRFDICNSCLHKVIEFIQNKNRSPIEQMFRR